jgi:hypothetical protein
MARALSYQGGRQHRRGRDSVKMPVVAISVCSNRLRDACSRRVSLLTMNECLVASCSCELEHRVGEGRRLFLREVVPGVRDLAVGARTGEVHG